MELERFIEEEIRSFLDTYHPSAPQPVALAPEDQLLYQPSRDYAKELDAAIAANDALRAKRILFDVKAAFDSQKPDAPERTELKKLFEALYLRFKQFFHKDDPEFTAFLRSIGVLAQPPPPEKKTETVLPLRKPVEKPPVRSISTAAFEGLRDELALLHRLVARNDLRDAMAKYHELRARIVTMTLSAEQHEALFDEMRSVYRALHEALNERERPERIMSASVEAPAAPPMSPGSSSSSSSSAPPAAPLSPSSAAPLAAAGLFDEHRLAAEEALRSQDYEQAISHYGALRTLVTQLPEPDRSHAHDALRSIYDAIRAAVKPAGRRENDESNDESEAPRGPRQWDVLEKNELKLAGKP